MHFFFINAPCTYHLLLKLYRMVSTSSSTQDQTSCLLHSLFHSRNNTTPKPRYHLDFQNGQENLLQHLDK